MRLIFITPKVDPDDPLLGFIHTWVLKLAARVDALHVIQLWRTSPPLPANVQLDSLRRGEAGGKVAVLARLASALRSACWPSRPDGIVAHMGPIFAISAAPFARLAGVPLALWYAHGNVDWRLRLAHLLVDRIGTSTPEGFRIPSSKRVITGQGIDTERFVPGCERMPNRIVSVGRMSPIKHHEILVEAAAELARRGVDLRAEIVGGATLPSERAYLSQLVGQVERLGLRNHVEIVPGVAHTEIASHYQRASLFVSCSETGSLDKVVLEAAACGAVPITTNPAFSGFFGPWASEHLVPPRDVPALAELMGRWLGRPTEELAHRASELRARVVNEHGVDHLADELIRLVQPRAGLAAPRAAS